MLLKDKPDDYVIATGETHTVREFVESAFKELDIEKKYVDAIREGKGGIVVLGTGKLKRVEGSIIEIGS